MVDYSKIDFTQIKDVKKIIPTKPIYDDAVEIDMIRPKEDDSRYGVPVRYRDTTFDVLDDTEGLRACKKYSEKIKKYVSEGVGLILMGGVGTGKTSAGIAIIKHYISIGGNALFVSCVDMVDAFYTMPQQVRQDYERRIRTVPVLMIDDFGAENNKDWVSNKIESIINDRYNNKKTTIITTNLNVNSIQDEYSLRLIDRLKASCKIVTFKGKSKREVLGGLA